MRTRLFAHSLFQCTHSSEEHEVSELIEESKKLLDWGEGKVEYLPNRIKLFADGAMYSQNMVLSEGYLDGHQGAWLMQEGLYRSVFKLFWDGDIKFTFIKMVMKH